MTSLLLLTLLLQGDSVVLENEYVKVTRNGAPCALGRAPECGDRVIVALGTLEMPSAGRTHKMSRGDVAVFPAGETYRAPTGGDYVEVTLKPDHPPVKSPPELIAPEKNLLLYDGPGFFVFEEKLDPGDTRQRHSHSQRVVIVLNDTRLHQWPDGKPEVFKTQVPDKVKFNPPVIHVVKTVGEKPLRNIVIELKPERRASSTFR
ncbi:MAG: hypothetical protein ACE5JI_01215 [Acidobacteriota bacterium]